VFIFECLKWNSGSQLTIYRRGWLATVASTSADDGHSSVNNEQIREPMRCQLSAMVV